MKIVKGRLIEKIDRTPSIMSSRFILDEKLDFAPGQFCKVIFDEKDANNRELNKYLSFSSSPLREYIEVTKRLSKSAFSERLMNLALDDEVLFNAPMGNCKFSDEYKKIGFLIGGIGITPVISILEYISARKLPTDVLLYYSNRTEKDIAFKKELDYFSSRSDNVKIVYTITGSEPLDTRCIHGTINKDLLLKDKKGIKDRLMYIFGPPKMVEAMSSLCVELDCNKDKILAENFIGY